MSTRFYSGQKDYIVQLNLMDDQFQQQLNSTTVAVADDTASNVTVYPVWSTVGGATSLKVSSTKLSFNPSTGLLTAAAFSSTGNATIGGTLNVTGIITGTLSGNVTGNVTGDVSGNAGTATKLATPRAINGVNFDGSAAITVTANTPNALTFNNGGAGVASGSTYNGGAAITVSYNTVGAPSTTGTNASGTWGISISGNAATSTAAATTNDTTTNATVYPVWSTASTGNNGLKVSSTKLSFNPSTGVMTATGFSGPLTGNVTGNVSGTAANITGVAAAANGGTGQSSYTIGDILYASGAAVLSKLAAAATGNALISGGAGVAPSWGKVGLTTHVSGTLPVANGGTGQTTIAGIKTALSLDAVDNTSDANKPVSTAQQAALNGVVSFRNKIRNGNFNIAQRGTSLTNPAHNSYTLDGWLWWRVNAGVADVAQIVGSSNEFLRGLGVTITTADTSVAATDYSAITQPVEGFLIRDLLGNPMTIQFRVKSSVTGTYYVALRNVNGGSPDRSYLIPYTISTANTWETKTLAVPAGLTTGGTWNVYEGMGMFITFTLMAGSNYHGASANTWLNANVMAMADQANVFNAVGNVFGIAGVQVEAGSQSTKFEHRDPQTELSFCQRYFETGGATIISGWQGAGATVYNNYQFKVTKRSTPSIVLTSSGASNASGLTAGNYDSSCFRADATITGAGAGYILFTWTASSEL